MVTIRRGTLMSRILPRSLLIKTEGLILSDAALKAVARSNLVATWLKAIRLRVQPLLGWASVQECPLSSFRSGQCAIRWLPTIRPRCEQDAEAERKDPNREKKPNPLREEHRDEKHD
jgi:hypothetical protein